MGQDWDYEYLI